MLTSWLPPKPVSSYSTLLAETYRTMPVEVGAAPFYLKTRVGGRPKFFMQFCDMLWIKPFPLQRRK